MSTRKGVVTWRCESCDTPMTSRGDPPGTKMSCPMCGAISAVPEKSTPGVKPVRLKVKQIGKSTYQIICPRCNFNHNFRHSSLGSVTKCRSCGYKIALPDSVGGGCGCLALVVLIGVAASAVAVALLPT